MNSGCQTAVHSMAAALTGTFLGIICLFLNAISSCFSGVLFLTMRLGSILYPILKAKSKQCVEDIRTVPKNQKKFYHGKK